MHHTTNASGTGNENSQKMQQGCEGIEGKKKGLDYMALQMNVFDKRRDLQRKGKITPAEYMLLEEIEAATIGGRNPKGRVGSTAEISVQELSKRMGYKTTNKIWVLLKSLHFKKIIIREKTQIKTIEIIGLNTKVFGQILTDTWQEKEERRHLKLAVDNSKNSVDNFSEEHTEHKSITHAPYADHTRSVGPSHTERVLKSSEHIEITKEKSSLDSFRFISDSFKEKKPFHFFETEEAKIHKIRVLQQLEDMKAGRL